MISCELKLRRLQNVLF